MLMRLIWFVLGFVVCVMFVWNMNRIGKIWWKLVCCFCWLVLLFIMVIILMWLGKFVGFCVLWFLMMIFVCFLVMFIIMLRWLCRRIKVWRCLLKLLKCFWIILVFWVSFVEFCFVWLFVMSFVRRLLILGVWVFWCFC